MNSAKKVLKLSTDFFSSDELMGSKWGSRLLYLGLCAFCDNKGIFPAKYSLIRAKIFPSDPIKNSTLQDLIDELLNIGLIHFADEEHLHIHRLDNRSIEIARGNNYA